MRWKTILIFVFIMLVYAALGGMVFHFVETAHENEIRDEAYAELSSFLQSHPCLSTQSLSSLIPVFKNLAVGGLEVSQQSGSLVNVTNWDIPSSIFLASQIIGSIGYGYVTPRTVGGRIFTVFYTILGLPLFISFAFGIGRPIAQVVQVVERCCCPAWVAETMEPLDGDEWKHLKARVRLHRIWIYVIRIFILFAVGSVFFVLIPAIIFHVLEPWTYWESVYFCYISALTIGSGDFVPGDSPDSVYASQRDLYLLGVSCWLYLCVGFFVVVFTPIEQALNYRKAINIPLELKHAHDVPASKLPHKDIIWGYPPFSGKAPEEQEVKREQREIHDNQGFISPDRQELRAPREGDFPSGDVTPLASHHRSPMSSDQGNNFTGRTVLTTNGSSGFYPREAIYNQGIPVGNVTSAYVTGDGQGMNRQLVAAESAIKSSMRIDEPLMMGNSTQLYTPGNQIPVNRGIVVEGNQVPGNRGINVDGNQVPGNRGIVIEGSRDTYFPGRNGITVGNVPAYN